MSNEKNQVSTEEGKPELIGLVMSVTAINLPDVCDLASRNNAKAEVIKVFHSQEFGTSLQVKFSDGKTLSLSPGQYVAADDLKIKWNGERELVIKPYIGRGLRSIQRYSSRCTT